jgi:hypothetical protein
VRGVGIVGGEALVQPLLRGRKRRADRDADGPQPGRRDRDEQSLRGQNPILEVGETSFDELRAGKR